MRVTAQDGLTFSKGELDMKKEKKVLVEVEVKKNRKEAAERMKAYAERLSKAK